MARFLSPAWAAELDAALRDLELPRSGPEAGPGAPGRPVTPGTPVGPVTVVQEVSGTPEGDVRRAFYLSYNDAYCEYLMPDEVEQRVENGQQVVSANFVTPYPPGYPVLVPGQVFSQQILSFMRSLDTPEVHGYRPDLGYRVYIDKALEIATAATAMEIAIADGQPPEPEARPARSGSKGSSGSKSRPIERQVRKEQK